VRYVPSDPSNVLVSEYSWHTHHTPSSDEDIVHLQPKPEERERVQSLLELGLTPKQVLEIVNNDADIKLGSHATTDCEAYVRQFMNRRQRFTHALIYAERKRLRRRVGFQGPDVEVVEAMVRTSPDLVVHYQAYTQQQSFALILSTPFQRRMLVEFGAEMVLMDATGGTNRNGFHLYAMLVGDEWGSGVPVAWMLTSGKLYPSLITVTRYY
jgi:hypothetical protein